jgi:hypothetical protein
VRVKLTEAVGDNLLSLLERGEVHITICLMRAIQRNDHPFASFPLPPLDFSGRMPSFASAWEGWKRGHYPACPVPTPAPGHQFRGIGDMIASMRRGRRTCEIGWPQLACVEYQAILNRGRTGASDPFDRSGGCLETTIANTSAQPRH